MEDKVTIIQTQTKEEKAKRYDEAIERAREYKKHGYMMINVALDNIFPELRESEDERIRKELITHCRNTRCVTEEGAERIVKWIAWLEKQGEHQKFVDSIQIGDKVTRNQDGILVNLSQLNRVAKPTDKVEPKFYKGEWITNGDYTWKIVEVQPLDYILQSQDGNIVDDTISHVDGQFHSFTIEDAKDGDVLYSPCLSLLWIFKSIDTVYCGCNLNYNDGAFCGEGYIERPTDAIPATKEQRDLLFAKMKEAGYEWNAETKELKKIEQPHAWSEEDEKILNGVITNYESGYLPSVEKRDEIIEKLASLKDRYTWKPSDEHYELEEFAKIVRGNLTGISKAVQELFEAKYLQLTGNKMYKGFKD